MTSIILPKTFLLSFALPPDRRPLALLSKEHAIQRRGGFLMLDLLFIALTLALFAASVAYTHLCDRV